MPLFPFERAQKDGTGPNSTQFSKAKNVFVSGHDNGAINFWDVSCPNPLPIVSLTQQVMQQEISILESRKAFSLSCWSTSSCRQTMSQQNHYLYLIGPKGVVFGDSNMYLLVVSTALVFSVVYANSQQEDYQSNNVSLSIMSTFSFFCLLPFEFTVTLTLQSEDNLSLSGVPLTALCLTSDLHILISGDQSGTVSLPFMDIPKSKVFSAF